MTRRAEITAHRVISNWGNRRSILLPEIVRSIVASSLGVCLLLASQAPQRQSLTFDQRSFAAKQGRPRGRPRPRAFVSSFCVSRCASWSRVFSSTLSAAALRRPALPRRARPLWSLSARIEGVTRVYVCLFDLSFLCDEQFYEKFNHSYRYSTMYVCVRALFMHVRTCVAGVDRVGGNTSDFLS